MLLCSTGISVLEIQWVCAAPHYRPIAQRNRLRLREATQISKGQSQDYIPFHLTLMPIISFHIFLFDNVTPLTLTKHLERNEANCVVLSTRIGMGFQGS